MDIDNILFSNGFSKNQSSPGSIGGKIKRIRELKGLTQKELGIKCGFSASTADVRIAQYEGGKKIPREKALKDIAEALEIYEGALFDADFLPLNNMYHALFDIEDFHGLHPVEIDGKFFLEFGGPTIFGRDAYNQEFLSFLKLWNEMRQKYAPSSTDSEMLKKEKKTSYSLWRYGYPLNEATENTERLRKIYKMSRLQAEMDAAYADLNQDSTFERIDKELANDLALVKRDYKDISYYSEFIYLIMEMIEEGVPIERFSPQEDYGYDYVHLISFKVEDIFSDDKTKKLFALLFCQIDTMNSHGLGIEKSITSKDQELYLTFKVISSQYDYLEIIDTLWRDITFIAERRGHWTDSELKEYEERLHKAITGDNDIDFSEL